ncbi:MAG: type II toxin-antitoxin system Phd/YefM family antitoxin [Deinococcus sp.]
MSAYSSKYFKDHANRVLAETIDNSDETVITLDSGEAVVVIPLSQYESWKETHNLISNTANGEHLLESIRQYREGKIISKTLEELEQAAQS